MKMKTTLPVLLALFLVGYANPAHGSFTMEMDYSGAPITELDVHLHGSGMTFLTPGLINLSAAGWVNTSTTSTDASASGPATAYLDATANFTAQPTTYVSVVWDWYNGNTLLQSFGASYDPVSGHWNAILSPPVVPEPSALLAGVLLLVPLGFQGVRYLRSKRERT